MKPKNNPTPQKGEEKTREEIAREIILDIERRAVLKVLDEVEERVIGEDEKGCINGRIGWIGGRSNLSQRTRNNLRAEQRQILNEIRKKI